MDLPAPSRGTLGLLFLSCAATQAQPAEVAPVEEVTAEWHDELEEARGAAGRSELLHPDRVFELPAAATRVLRGDWEPPERLVVAYDESWLGALSLMIAESLVETEVLLLASQKHRLRDVRALVDATVFDGRRAEIAQLDFDTPWVRDYGPLEVYDAWGRTLWLDFWYENSRKLDDDVPRHLAQRLRIPLEPRSNVLDGGAVVSNGQGLCAMTDYSLGEMGLTTQNVGGVQSLMEAIGCSVLALLPALPDEPTGHVDMFAQFLAEGTVALSYVAPNVHPNEHDALSMAAEILVDAARIAGADLKFVRLPMMIRDDVYYTYVNGARLPESFLVPQYAGVPEPAEELAYRRLSRALEGLALIPIPADQMIAEGGAVHCLTLGLGGLGMSM